MKKLFFLFAVLAVPWASSGQEYPSRPVRVVVPYVAGGAADIFARTLGQKLSEAFKQGFVVENKPGANGGIGADFVAKSAPDGYTLLATASGPIVVNPVLYATVPYDPVRDFVPVAQATVYQYVLVALASSPLRGIDDVVAAALAEVPTMQEAGIAGFDISQWQGFLAPAGAPRPIVERLNAEIARALRAPDVRERLVTRGGNEIVTGAPEDFAALIRSDLQSYARLIKEANIPAQ